MGKEADLLRGGSRSTRNVASGQLCPRWSRNTAAFFITNLTWRTDAHLVALE